MTATGRTIKVGDVTLPEHTDTLSFTVPPTDKIKPEQATRAGEKYEKTFVFPQVSSVDEAELVALEKEWTLVEFVNDKLKNAARASAYQNEAALYRVTEISAEDIKDRMVRDFIRLGHSEAEARALLDSLMTK